MKYVKKPVIIEAIKWTGCAESFTNITTTFSDMIWWPGDMGSYSFKIKTLEGWILASNGDYIIKGVAGEFYPCKPDVFNATYSPVEG